MFAMDIPYVPVQETPLVLAQTVTSGAESATQQPDYILKECQETESMGDPRSAMRGVDPAYMLKNYIQNRDDHYVDLASIKTTLLEGTTHGEITTEVDNTGRTSYGYDPVPEYIGKDRAVFMAEFEGKRYKIVVNLVVSLGVDENSPQCPEPQLIKVKKSAPNSSGNDLNSLPINFAALESGALGQTDLSGTAASSTITSDVIRRVNNELTDVCRPSENQTYIKDGEASPGKLNPGRGVVNALNVRYGIIAKGEVHAVVTQPPSHGKVRILGQATQSFPATPTDVYEYTPNADFLGEDRVAFEVTVNGQKFHVSYLVKVVEASEFDDACSDPDEPEGDYQGSMTPRVELTIASLEVMPDDTLPNGSQGWLLASALGLPSDNAVSVVFQDLPAGAIGQTNGTSITLDDTAAGHGWFIDYTPWLNDEFLPTADPTVWQAR